MGDLAREREQLRDRVRSVVARLERTV
jgi:hypothetical protein